MDIKVTIDSDDLLNLFMERMSHWTSDDDELDLWERYYKSAIENDLFEGWYFDVMGLIDNDYVNNYKIITKDEFDEWNMEDENDERIMMTSNDGKLFLISRR